MRCRRICRELLWLARFGEFGPSSAPHLDHLADCRSCRDEVGFDRALVRQLRTALAARIEATSPSPRAWEGVLERMRQPEPRPARIREWSATLVARLRVGSAMAGASLALVLALNVDLVMVVPVEPSAPAEQEAAASSLSRTIPSADGLRNSGQLPRGAAGPVISPPEADVTVTSSTPSEYRTPDAEHALVSGPLTGSTRAGTDSIAPADEPAEAAPTGGTAVGEWRALTIRVTTPGAPSATDTTVEGPDEADAGTAAPSAPAPAGPGGPS